MEYSLVCVCRNTGFLEPNAVPKLLDDQMHTMVLQIISYHSTLMQFLFHIDENHYLETKKSLKT